jgi:hypothetical protein
MARSLNALQTLATMQRGIAQDNGNVFRNRIPSFSSNALVLGFFGKSPISRPAESKSDVVGVARPLRASDWRENLSDGHQPAA